MALTDVLNKIDINDFTPAQEALITSTITNLYNKSATARATFDKIADVFFFDQDINFVANAFQSAPNVIEAGSDVEIDPDFIIPLHMIDETGTVVDLTFERGLMHELVHAVEGLSDEPDTRFVSIASLPTLTDYRGSTVTLTNTIMSEVGETTGRLGYGSASFRLTLGDELSLGENVDAGFVVSGTFDMTVSTRSTRDVLYASNAADNLLGGLGRDFLHGLGANDRLTGGEGDDYIDGGDGQDVAVYDGGCDDYAYSFSGGQLTVTDTRAGAPDGTDTLVNVEFLEFSDGTRATVGTDAIACPGQSVLLAIDVSGSMGDDIAAVQQSAAALVESLFGAEATPFASRLAIITFNDTGAFRTELQFTDHPDIADRKAAALAAIAQVSILGGGAEPLNRAVLSGLQGDAGPWVPGMTANRVIVFSDEPAADPELRSQVIAAATNLSIGLETGATGSSGGALVAQSIFTEIVNPYTPAEQSSSASVFSVFIGTDPGAQADFEELASATGGSVISAPTAADTAGALEALLSTQIAFTGTDEGETLTANVNNNVIDAAGGDDVVIGLAGDDTITLGSGADTASGTLSDLYGDTITDFTEEDRIVIQNIHLDRDRISVTSGSAILGIDDDGDGLEDGAITLEGDFSGGDFMSVRDAANTVITFETFLTTLNEGQAVDAGLVNGIVNQNFLKGDGTTDFKITLRDLGFAGYDNAVGVYEIDAGGNIVDARILFENANADKAAEATIADVDAGNLLGFFIIQDAAAWTAALASEDTLSFVNTSGVAANTADGSDISLAVNGVAVDQMVFHSFSDAMNSDGLQHALSGVDFGGESISVGFEDLTGGGDMDYEDVAFRIELVDALIP